MHDIQQFLADLDWVVHSPSLVDLPGYGADTPLIDISTVDPQRLAEAVKQQKSRFLGPYFETLWRFSIEHSQSHSLLAHGLQVTDEKRTLGEFDFLLQDKASQAIIHQEIAVKYYLGVGLPAPADTDQKLNAADCAWFGPNSIDRLDLKLHKLVQQQILLSDRRESQETLKRLDINTPPAKQILMKGYLFQPLNDDLPAPAFCHPEAAFGRWLPLESIHQLEPISDRWAILPKLRWLSRARSSVDHTMDFSVLRKHLLEANGRPMLIAAMKPESKEELTEISRFFVVSDHWQDKAVESLEMSPLTSFSRYNPLPPQSI
ncbi:hypothetical protein BTA51_09540 [Hahella sp. CCB-MM4]|uniref:DUF1853 family protein n=1 Tax=Hahella sp. (strain CCB-MM4) TaxID=1926491 RepID=UPI000BDBEF7A|nr:DUF1853 family protein [Hahella sp. CCB-MM4]OZG74012.1 hypothetical protein BTA51_09540 [Hahella sp. CCB-MM4]